jgi:uncharacterized BrkB/YihY/UPF0761 family membrane protein
MLFSMLFLVGYVLGTIGTAFIVAPSIQRVMGFGDESAHADPDSSADALMIVIVTVAGTALMWPAVWLLYAVLRRRLTTAA